jgi:hypothetical protein
LTQGFKRFTRRPDLPPRDLLQTNPNPLSNPFRLQHLPQGGNFLLNGKQP